MVMVHSIFVVRSQQICDSRNFVSRREKCKNKDRPQVFCNFRFFFFFAVERTTLKPQNVIVLKMLKKFPQGGNCFKANFKLKIDVLRERDFISSKLLNNNGIQLGGLIEDY